MVSAQAQGARRIALWSSEQPLRAPRSKLVVPARGVRRAKGDYGAPWRCKHGVSTSGEHEMVKVEYGALSGEK